MRTTILAYVIAFLGLLMIGGGIWDLLDLLRHRARTEIPIRHYGMAIGTICVGVGIGGIAQVLRLLVAIAPQYSRTEVCGCRRHVGCSSTVHGGSKSTEAQNIISAHENNSATHLGEVCRTQTELSRSLCALSRARCPLRRFFRRLSPFPFAGVPVVAGVATLDRRASGCA